MNTSRSAGGIVLNETSAIALVRIRGSDGALLFPKGHIDAGENDEEAARREIQEETGLTNLELLDDLGTYKRPHINSDGSYDTQKLKEIHMFLFCATPGAVLTPTHEVESAEWIPYRSVAERVGNEIDCSWFSGVFRRVQEAVQRD